MSAVATVCPFCGVGCGLVLGVEAGRVTDVRPEAAHPVSRGQLCAKGWNAEKFLRDPERLTTPLVRRARRASSRCRGRTRSTPRPTGCGRRCDEAGPDAVGVISSARATNEDNFAAMKFARAVLGTNNIDHCARVCHAPSVAGLSRTLGSGRDDQLDRRHRPRRLLLVVGSDTTENHPIIGARMLAAQARGVPLIVIDPRRTRLARMADLHLQLRLGTDIPLVNGMLHAIFAHGWEDARLPRRALRERGRAARVGRGRSRPSGRAELTGVPAAAIVDAARRYATTPRAFLVYGLGVTQHVCGTENVIALSNLALVTGHVGVEGAGINPLRGQNNVQGACDMGALPDVYSGYQSVERPRRTRAASTRPGASSCRRARGSPRSPCSTRRTTAALRCCSSSRRGPGRHRSRAARGAARARSPRLPDRRRALPHRDREARRRRPAGRELRREGRHLHLDRAPRAARPSRGRAAGRVPRPTGRSSRRSRRRLGRPMGFTSAEQIFAEMARLTPIYGGMSYARLESTAGSSGHAGTRRIPGPPVLHREHFPRGRGRLIPVGAHAAGRAAGRASTRSSSPPSACTTRTAAGSMTRRAPLLERENPRGIALDPPRRRGRARHRRRERPCASARGAAR